MQTERDGRLILVVGYNRETAIMAGGKDVPEVSTEDAVPILLDLLNDYRFATEGDRSRALAQLISPALVFGRMVADGRVPAGLIEADKSQAGKGHLVAMTTAIYGCEPYIIAQSKGGVGSADERLSQAMIDKRPFIVYDNWRGRLESEALEAALTCKSFSARVPYRAAVEVDPSTSNYMLTSNGLESTEDLANRTNIIRIRKQPSGYRFHQYGGRGVLDHIKRHQSQYLGAVFAIIRAWHRAGKPLSEEGRHDFRDWAGTCDWMVRELFQAAPLMDGAEEAKKRITNRYFAWLRQVAIHVEEAGQGGEWLRSNRILDILIRAADVDIPGVGDNDDPTEDKVRTKALQQIGRRLGLCFQGNCVVVDGIKVKRETENDSNGHQVRTYCFTRPASPDDDDSGNSGEQRGNPYCDTDDSQGSRYSSAIPPLIDPLLKSPFPHSPANPANGSQHRARNSQKGAVCADSGKVCDPIAGIAGTAGDSDDLLDVDDAIRANMEGG